MFFNDVSFLSKLLFILKQIEKVENNEDIEATHTKPTRNFMWISLDKLN